ncbi:MAG: hypothetical protein KW793_03870 [Candidatus Doudnabacteria bacterium]|nr:hypothetical protein [Candidatus Doudnabacteria bacterium]
MKQLNIFHNTINLLPSEKADREVKACKQNEKILKLFEDNKYTDFTSAEVHLRFGQQLLITSVRRAISTLYKMGLLIQTENQRVGLYGTKNNCYKFNPDYREKLKAY